MNSRGSRLDGGGYLNNTRQWIHGSPNEIENGELASSARQWIRGAPDSLVEDGTDGFDNYNGGYNGGYDVDNDNHDGDGSIVIF